MLYALLYRAHICIYYTACDYKQKYMPYIGYNLTWEVIISLKWKVRKYFKKSQVFINVNYIISASFLEVNVFIVL